MTNLTGNETTGDLIAIVRDLDTKIKELEIKLEDAAELMVAAGRIHNTPHSKTLWMLGKQ